MTVMIVGLIWLGLYPQPVLDTAQPVLDSLMQMVGSVTEPSRVAGLMP